VRRHPGAAGLVPHLAADLVERVGGPGDHVEPIGGEHGALHPVVDHLRDPLGRIGADQVDLGAPFLAEEVEEGAQGLLVAPDGRPHEAGWCRGPRR